MPEGEQELLTLLSCPYLPARTTVTQARQKYEEYYLELRATWLESQQAVTQSPPATQSPRTPLPRQAATALDRPPAPLPWG